MAEASEPRKRTLPRAWLAGALLLHLLPFLSRPALIGGDEPHYALMAHSIATDADISLEDDYAAVAGGSPAAGRKRAGQDLDRHLRTVEGIPRFAHPLGLPALAAPLVALQQAIAPGTAPDLLLGLLTLSLTFAALVAGTQVLARQARGGRLGAIVGLAVYFSSPLWFYGRTFTTEPYIWAWSVLAIASIASGRMVLASVFLALSLAMKETAILIVAPVLLVSLLARQSLVLFLGPGVYGALFVVKNLLSGSPPFTTFQPYRSAGSLEGVLGFVIDPQRGLLWFAPLLLLAVLGWPATLRPGRHRWAGAAALLALVSYYLLSAFWIDWRGGSGYGPRLLVPVLPVLALPLRDLLRARPHRLLRGALAVSFVAGFTVNWCAALRPVQAFWSAAAGELVFEHPFTALAGTTLALGLVWRANRMGLLSQT